ncbi:ATPase [Crenothrix polyspora]|uniref:ATPase n=1 Tax=Crenothrix polyspora TaxID=360316 RepID=A0A1R4H3S8_9GAMM|nr:AAA family ATPase [Crenothrix polyspora]SJM90879.1 ATPase [Crenothrix polyspora]
MLTNIKIEKLFDIFDYDIEFKNEGITILTGPNGYGKTTVLKILDALASKNGFFFIRLLFKKITLRFSNGEQFTLEKKKDDEVTAIFADKSKPLIWNSKSMRKALKSLDFFRQIDENTWIDRRTDDFYKTDALLQKVILEYPELAGELGTNEYPKQLPSIYFIREQRLLRPVLDTRIRPRQRNLFELQFDKEAGTFSNTIEEYAKELRENIKETLAKSSQINQELDSSFPRRLFDQTQDISEEEFKLRFDKVKQIQKSLNEFGLSDVKEDSHPTYKITNAKALCVYIEDTEKKLAVFSELLGKLKTFTEILNERRFTFKRMDISNDDGFKFSTDQGKPLQLSDLSSGEQQEVVMLYELLFKVKTGTMVLIDEPELSLHVVWQKQFLDDLFQIIKLKKINIVIATHSPQIINNHWDLTIDLEELRDAAISR